MSALVPIDPSERPSAKTVEGASPAERRVEMPRSGIALWRIALAGLVAFGADSIGVIPGEALPVVFDIAVGVTLTLILGPRIALLGALVLEAIPLLGVFPSWVAAVAWIAFSHGERRS